MTQNEVETKFQDYKAGIVSKQEIEELFLAMILRDPQRFCLITGDKSSPQDLWGYFYKSISKAIDEYQPGEKTFEAHISHAIKRKPMSYLEHACKRRPIQT
jgi:hypothetical protein